MTKESQIFQERRRNFQIPLSASQINGRFVGAMKIGAARDKKFVFGGKTTHVGLIHTFVGRVDCFDSIQTAFGKGCGQFV